MKNAIILHGMPSKQEYLADPTCSKQENQHWLQWIKKELSAKNISAEAPLMLIPYLPEYEAWKKVFETFPLTPETILIGHSCGGGFLVRYLSENDVHVGKVVLVAPWLDPRHVLDTGFFDFEIDPTIVEKTRGITVFSSTDDMDDIHESVRIIVEKIKDVEVVNFDNMGHFCYDDMGTDAFPELLVDVID